MAENFSIEHSRTKITEVKKTIEDKKQKLDELKQQKKSAASRFSSSITKEKGG